MKQKIVIVLGPTGSGKSAIAVELAKQFNGFLISADSRQVYKEMDIGTNKDKGEWKNGKYMVDGIEEYMTDIIAPDQAFSLDDWLKQTKDIIKENSESLAIVVGGTGLYVSALVKNYQLQGGQDLKLREKLEKQVEKKGIEWLLKKIKKIDPDIENKISVQNSRRVIRAAEVVLSTKKPFDTKTGESEFEFLQIGKSLTREELYSKINKRVDQMKDEGLVDEVQGLIKKGYKCESSAMSGIGYRQICEFLKGDISLDEALEFVKRDTRRYAKRQITWFKRDSTIHWVSDYTEAEMLVKQFMK